VLPDGRVVEVLPDGSFRDIPDKTDWKRLRNMTDEEIEANALSDPEFPPLTDEEFERMRPIPNPARIRRKLEMTQLEFAEAFEIPLATLQKWESDWVLTLDSTVMTLLRAIEQDPEAIKAALARSHQPVD
jgi:putative transcriptional regulator